MKLPDGSLILCRRKKIVLSSPKLLDLDVCNDNKSFMALASDIILCSV